MTNKNIIYPLLKELVTDLSEEKYNEIFKSGRNGRLTKDEILNAIDEYPGKITSPPENAYNEFSQYDYNDNNEECAVEFDLWFDNKKSDLTLRAEVAKDNEGIYRISIQDILVM